MTRLLGIIAAEGVATLAGGLFGGVIQSTSYIDHPAYMLMAGAFAWFGIIHSPLPSGPIKAPGAVLRQLSEEGRATASAHQTPYHCAAAYAAMASTVLLLGKFGHRPAIHEVDAPRSA